MMNIELFDDKERLKRASSLTLRSIAEEGLVDKYMWVKYLGAIYTNEVVVESVCPGCNYRFKRTLGNFNRDKRSLDGLTKKCKWCINERKIEYKARLVKNE